MTATETIWAVESCAMTEAEALQRSGAATMVAVYRMAILELAPQLRDRPRNAANHPTRRSAAA